VSDWPRPIECCSPSGSVQELEWHLALRPQPFLLKAGPGGDKGKPFLGEADNFVSGQ
jgi:hypothetical protein